MPPRKLFIRRADLDDLLACGPGAAADLYVEYAPDTAFITHHEAYVPAALCEEQVREARAAAFEEAVSIVRSKGVAFRKEQAVVRALRCAAHEAKASRAKPEQGGGG